MFVRMRTALRAHLMKRNGKTANQSFSNEIGVNMTFG